MTAEGFGDQRYTQLTRYQEHSRLQEPGRLQTRRGNTARSKCLQNDFVKPSHRLLARYQERFCLQVAQADLRRGCRVSGGKSGDQALLGNHHGVERRVLNGKEQ